MFPSLPVMGSWLLDLERLDRIDTSSSVSRQETRGQRSRGDQRHRNNDRDRIGPCKPLECPAQHTKQSQRGCKEERDVPDSPQRSSWL